MNCAKCSKPLTDDSKYCAFCGADAALRSSQERPRPTGVQKVLGLLVLVAAAVGRFFNGRPNECEYEYRDALGVGLTCSDALTS